MSGTSNRQCSTGARPNHIGSITKTQSSGNVAQVWIDSATHQVAVSLDGKSHEFTAGLVSSITYMPGAKGGYTFTVIDGPSATKTARRGYCTPPRRM
jgi:hypothetical protein